MANAADIDISAVNGAKQMRGTIKLVAP